MNRILTLLFVLLLLPLGALEKLDTSYKLKLPEYMEEGFKSLKTEKIQPRWLWVNDKQPIEFIYISKDKSSHNYDEAFIGERYLSTLELELFVESYRNKAFPGINGISINKEVLDAKGERVLVHWFPPDYKTPVQRLSLFVKGSFGGIYIFSFVANHTKVTQNKLEEWKFSLKQSRVNYLMR
ncbi:hypothetical protein AB751O23_AB_00370 [Chlamydiales bacterium SCGC AB-751-O23]|jgi:hypothetical protein|nr:hypothetical protein AB751O23_AB_00370 [Chlamydiales bacterium SCGC AB-751-O23]